MTLHSSNSLDGLNDFGNQLSEYLNKLDKEEVEKVLEVVAKSFVDDLLKLPKPMSKINKSGYTHLVDSFSYEKSKSHTGEIDVGWGKYYGYFLEYGTVKMKAVPHLVPTYNKNKNKYDDLMIDKFLK